MTRKSEMDPTPATPRIEVIRHRWRDPISGYLTKYEHEHAASDIDDLLNAHDALLAALRALVGFFDDVDERYLHAMGVSKTSNAIEQARALLRQIDGKRTLADDEDAMRAWAALAAEPADAGHEPGEHHRYRIECEVCGERGTVNLSVEPQRALAATPVGEKAVDNV